MITGNRLERLQRALADAVQALESQASVPPPLSGPRVGDLYVFKAETDVAIEWLVVRFHPDTGAEPIVLLAPVDDFSLVGCADVPLSVDRPATARCGQTTWAPATACTDNLRVGTVPEAEVLAVRRMLTELVHGRVPTNAANVEADPDYTAHVLEVAKSRRELERLFDSDILTLNDFTATLPSFLAPDETPSLAAQSGGPLHSALSEALAAGSSVYHDHPLATGGKLVLCANRIGLRVIWVGTAGGDTPPLLSRDEPDGRVKAIWCQSSQTGVHRANVLFEWVGGQVVLVVGKDNPEYITVRL